MFSCLLDAVEEAASQNQYFMPSCVVMHANLVLWILYFILKTHLLTFVAI